MVCVCVCVGGGDLSFMTMTVNIHDHDWTFGELQQSSGLPGVTSNVGMPLTRLVSEK